MGVIGLGTIAPYFLQAIEREPAVRLAAVCDQDVSRLAPYATDGPPCFTDYQEMLDRELLDAVIITLPNHLHFDVTATALEAGIHVCCEKPLTIRALEAQRLCDLSHRTGRTLFTAFHRRYNRNVVRFARWLPDKDEIAEVICRYQENIYEHTGGEAWYLDATRCGGGCVADNGPNVMDVLRLLLSDVTVTDSVMRDVRDGVEFGAHVTLESAQGVPVRVDLDWALPTGEVKDITVRLRNGRVATADMLAGFTGFKSSLHHEYAGILAAFRAAVASGTAHGEDGTAVTALIEDAYMVARAAPGQK